MDTKLVQLLSDVLELRADQLDEGTSAEQVAGWDSMKHLELVTALEQSYGVQLEMDEMTSLRSVGDIVACLRRHGAM